MIRSLHTKEKKNKYIQVIGDDEAWKVEWGFSPCGFLQS